MDKFKIDFATLDGVANPDDSTMPLEGNKHRLVRVAFDLFRLKDGDPEELWQVQSNDDGEFLVRTFSISDEEKIAESGDWTVEMDKKEANLTVAYKQIPLIRLAAKNYGANTPEDTMLLRRVIYRKLMINAEFGKKLFASLSADKQEMLKEAGAGLPGDPGPPSGADDEWRVAFLDLSLRKNSGLFEEEQEEYEKMLSGTGVAREWAESEIKLDEALEDQDTNTREAIDRAYQMIEHDLAPGSKNAIKLSELAWDVESGKKDYTELKSMMDELKGSSFADDAPGDYSDYFLTKCKKHGINPNDIPALAGERRKEFFDDVDAGWSAQNECGDATGIMLSDDDEDLEMLDKTE